MATRPRSLKHEYELYVDREIENYKESIPRSVILGIGEEAVNSLSSQQQLALTEILLCAEVDRIIRARLRIPSFATWRRRRLKALREFSRPERWGLRPDSAIARTPRAAAEGHVLVAGASEEGPAIYLAANGCAVTAVDTTEDVLERVMDAAAEVGLTGRVRGLVTDIASWRPDLPLNAVVCAAAAFNGLSPIERARAITILQNATTAGGMHVLEMTAEGVQLVTLEELRLRYEGWQISVERGAHASETFLATKSVA
ncbi:MAG TPA: hypothetical protein VF041_10890 [Gemmatimonadaceae bacterium]